MNALGARLLRKIWSLSCRCAITSAASSPLRHALDIREHYERKLERANNLYMELSAVMLQLELKEKELQRYKEIANYRSDNILCKSHLHFGVTWCLIPGESSHWIRSIQVCSSTTVPDRVAPLTPWTNSSRREMFHRNSPQERGSRASCCFMKD